MSRLNRKFRLPVGALLIVAAAALSACGGGSSGSGVSRAGAGTGVGGLGHGPAPVNLRSAGNFVMLAQSLISDVPSSAVTGDVGLSPYTGTAIGISCLEVTGNIYSVDATGPACKLTNPSRLTTAVSDANTAYTDAAGRAPDYTELLSGNIGGLNLGPATYKWSSAVTIPTDVTLTGGPNDVWIFQIAQGLAIASGVHIILAGGAQAKNIYWQTFAAPDVGTTAHFNGVILSHTSVVMKTGATLNGRMFAGTAITLDQNVVTQPAP